MNTNILAKLLTKMCSKMGIQLYVNYMRRSETGVNEIKVMIEEGVIQKPIKILQTQN